MRSNDCIIPGSGTPVINLLGVSCTLLSFRFRLVGWLFDYVFYDWDDNGVGDCTGWPEHVGIVVFVTGNKIKVIEGNKNNAVEYREYFIPPGKRSMSVISINNHPMGTVSLFPPIPGNRYINYPLPDL